MNSTTLMALEALKFVGLGYMVGDLIEGYVTSIQRERSSIIFFVLIVIGLIYGATHLVTFEARVKDFIDAHVFESVTFTVGLAMGLYREKIIRYRD